MDKFVDLHTHQPSPDEEVICVYNHLVQEKTDAGGGLFSAGLHPWYADRMSPGELTARLDKLASDPNMVAYGECGLDKVCNIPFTLQRDIFELHLVQAAEHQKPVILHCVKAWEELIEMTASYPIKKILHGYNGSTQLTNRLLQKGFYFSVGSAILNPGSKISRSIQTIPLASLFCETDTSEVSIKSIYGAISITLNIREEVLRSALFDNFCSLRSELK